MSDRPFLSTSVAEIPCSICGEYALSEIKSYRAVRRVTSDCKPWPAGGRMHVCERCGCIQKAVTPAFQDELGQIYGQYTIYHQSPGAEQATFDHRAGRTLSRSERVLEFVTQHQQLNAIGRALDVGCGNGSMLRALHASVPGWTLAGTELNDKARREIEAIPGVEGLFTCPVSELPGSFDLVTLVHVLEHIVRPVDTLRLVESKLAADGALAVQVPDLAQTPFEVVVADHTLHFTPLHARALIERAGFEVVAITDHWIAKEISLVARSARSQEPTPPPGSAAWSRALIDAHLAWLDDLVRSANRMSAEVPFGLFGTSIAATWLAAQLRRPATCYVDEDPNRIGQTFFGRPVFAPDQVPAGTDILVGLPTQIAEGICRRLTRPGVTYHAPPSV